MCVSVERITGLTSCEDKISSEIYMQQIYHQFFEWQTAQEHWCEFLHQDSTATHTARESMTTVRSTYRQNY